MEQKLKNFRIKFNKKIPVDELLERALYDPNSGYYNNRIPFGKKGDFITSPTISNLFSEIMGIWIVSTWEKLEKPKIFNVVELGPGDGSLTKVLINTFKKFPKFNKSVKLFLYEKSNLLKKVQKKKINNRSIKWIKSFDQIKDGPIIFFGNEFFDAIPIKQFSQNNNQILEKCFIVNKEGLKETYKKASDIDVSYLKSFNVLKGQKFIEYPKLGFFELDKVVKKISKNSGGILLIDYGYLDPFNQNTLQTVMKNKKVKLDKLLSHIGKSDITYLVNFNLLKEYFEMKNLTVKNIVTQKFFLEKMGIIDRAKILEKNMNNKEKSNMFLTLKRLLDKKFMGELFKVIFAFKSETDNYLGFN